MKPRTCFCLSIALMLFATGSSEATEPVQSPQAEPAQVEFRLLGGGKPALFLLDQSNDYRVGKYTPIPGKTKTFFTGITVSLTPSLDEQGDIAYTGTFTRYVFRDFQTQPDGSVKPVVSREQVQVKGSVKNHAAASVSFPKQGNTSYFALSDPARPKEDCEACGSNTQPTASPPAP